MVLLDSTIVEFQAIYNNAILAITSVGGPYGLYTRLI